LNRPWVTASHLEVWRLLSFVVYHWAAWCGVTDVWQVGVCNSPDVLYVSFIQIGVTLFIKKINVLCYLCSTCVILLD
jgi:hypothetical protein